MIYSIRTLPEVKWQYDTIYPMVILLTLILFFLNTKVSHGTSEFSTTQEITYQFAPSGAAQVNHKTNITNNFSQFYPTQYSLSISNSKATDIQAFDNDGNLPLDIDQSTDPIKLSLKLSNAKVGKDQITTFSINYKSNNLAHKKGKTWEIILPQFQDNLSDETNLTITVPVSFGKLSSSPSNTTISQDSQNTTVTFKKYNIKDKMILTFGEYQLFNFELNYRLKNDSAESHLFSIPLPPDTANQKITFTNINPSPQKIDTDPDGNWLAYFPISTNNEINITATGQAKIGQNIHYNFLSSPIFNSETYWPVDNSQIISLAKIYTTPHQIYDHVVSFLNYDFNRINDSTRHGALSALENPSSSLCTDFTDLFISVARAANIGAREIEGYAYSNNTDIKPLLAGADVLHAWPEYYNSTTQKWIPIDPTWGKTTGGINYFDDLDLNHFTFVIHNQKSDIPPPPGSYKIDPSQKSVNVSFADSEILPIIRNLNFSTNFNPFSKSTLIIKNPNLFSLDNFIINDHSPQNILPLGEIKIDFPRISFLPSLIPKNQNLTLTFSYNNEPQQFSTIQNPYHFFNLFIVIISSLIFLSIGAIIVLRKK